MKEDEHSGTRNQINALQTLFHHWFVLYNPLYFLSALFMLGGIYLVSPGFDQEGWQTWETVLTMVIELYGIFLIGGAAILFRTARQFRPAAILGLLAVFFLFDTTFQTEVLATFDWMGLFITGVWLLIAALKLVAIRWAFQLRISWWVLAVPFLAVTGIAVIPHLLNRTNLAQETIHLVAFWYGTCLAASILGTRPLIRSVCPLRESEQQVIQRLSNVTWMIWAGLYLYHLIAWLYSFHITPMTPLLYLAPGVVIFSLYASQEKLVWAGCVGTLLISLLRPEWFAPTAFLVSVVFGLKAFRIHRPQLYIGAVVTFCLALSTIGWHQWPFPAPQLWAMVLAAVGLVAIAVHFRLLTALLPLLLGAFPLFTFINTFGMTGWGVVLIVMAFVTLMLGVAINLKPRKQDRDDPRDNAIECNLDNTRDHRPPA